MINRTLLLPNYLGNSFPQTEQLPKPAVHYGEGEGSSRALLHDCKKLREPSFPACDQSRPPTCQISPAAGDGIKQLFIRQLLKPNQPIYQLSSCGCDVTS